MRLTHDVYLEQQQKLVMTPELRQAIAILQMSTLELSEYIQNELAENPLLEEKDIEYTEEETQENTDNNADVEDWLEYFNDRDIEYREKEVQEEKTFENFITKRPSLYEHLEFQLNLTNCDSNSLTIGHYLIGSIDNNGYLSIELKEVAEKANVAIDKVEEVLEVIQSFSPSGVGARNLQECLLIQLKHYGKDDSLTKSIVKDHLDDLSRNRINKIAQSLGVSVKNVQETCDLIRTLDPKPGLQYSSDEVKFIFPDVIVEKVDDEYMIVVNDSNFPRLTINYMYENLMRQSESFSGDCKKYMEEKMGSAIWLIKSIEQRRMTLYKVARCIVDIQKEFLDKGIKYLKPLNLKRVAELIDVHESTVSRATNNKYIQTPQGLFELKYFFSTGVSCQGDEQKSSKSIKNIISEIISNEDITKPLSDENITKILKEKGVKISRRTVSKYRQELGILSTSARKRYK
ncbi:RNA polymerase sigma-54 factor RpoN [Candidatus Syntrophocurvum alkaliphilum]|uniref:RNA polymerase sigma-54 factor RpoN n=1 Tax=Candidatus Syntrophocurvum alkaliphilum TaxID=2293317 RepID=A0A6I6DHV7_9FIRM|nr:RNA polymerase factor sigma-54 [Candidatus Syntrophocurvum alkaliphilum]QGU00359.1 RNA polymerase sigma-54 factor RpoN [Candidatus Syntrophocurvum alkaliphilum]